MSFERRFAEMVREHRRVALAEGREIGVAEGIVLGGEKASRSIAIRLLEMGLSLEQVVQATRLPLKDVARLDLELRGDGGLDDHLDG